MPAYDLKNSVGVSVAIVNVGTTTGSTFPIEIQGQGISPYGTLYGETVYHLLENFSNTVEPTNAVEGMDFYRQDLQIPHFYNGTKFVPYLTNGNSASGGFTMLPTAVDVDFASVQTVPLFTAPNDGSTFHVTQMILIPKTVVDVTGFPQFNLNIGASEDVLENVIAPAPALDSHYMFNVQGKTRFASLAETINLDIVIAATGGGGLDFTMDVFLFGYNKL
jgi:hypothetical protein